jgi:hypothetical protein
MVWPVMYDARSDARNATACAMSSGVASRPSGIAAADSRPALLAHQRLDARREN